MISNDPTASPRKDELMFPKITTTATTNNKTNISNNNPSQITLIWIISPPIHATDPGCGESAHVQPNRRIRHSVNQQANAPSVDEGFLLSRGYHPYVRLES
ncbi:hypothetical protein D8674_022891 [Pyrus ussuriensis x Pyrus communis]|uniref:Uncharacterized protein n=1 Tax=Pyrus ussuriensis x Pyrus communis TaxID=2448454 RepID=A0A5N5GNE6_9ROSA|nr:hypothetical protein D8674_022891 [Pyrus ussuriensis x Pyrus communis]